MTILLATAALMAAAPVTPYEDLDRLEARVVAALDAGIGEAGGPAAPIDRRLRLARCPEPVEIDPPALGAVALRCASLGWRIRVPQVRATALAQASPITPAVRAAPLVKRGDTVELRAEGGSFTVVGSGIADEDGVPGARIRVKVDRARPPVVGQVIDIGVVRIAAR